MSKKFQSASLFTAEARQKGRETSRAMSGECVTNAPILQELRGSLPATQVAKIAARVQEMPQTCRLTYLRAMRGRSAKAAIKALCQMCMGWDDFREGIRGCTDPACPLYAVRPYQEK